MKKIDLKQLVEFFDEKPKDSEGHATAISSVLGEDLGAFLIQHYLNQNSIKAEILDSPCTQGTKSGVRLDKWILAEEQNNKILYQVEIKNWSAHAIGGKKLSSTADAITLKNYKIDRWNNQFFQNNLPNKKQTLKVLTKMKSPIESCEIRPLLCFWDALHKEGKNEPFFWFDIEHDTFSKLWVFSMSSYVRNIRNEGLEYIFINELHMKNSLKRKDWIEKILN